ncbi:MAG: zinc dependent phospholipase C family protein [Defluviitaleaceae bacterium]|nr:zinc dependent phospholipase C family protein [Defluviitaleaceae bacterium]
MPGLITHYLGGQSALEILSPHIREHIVPMGKLFNLGTQGPDIFFYYVNGFLSKRIRGVGSQMHSADLGLFFMEMAAIRCPILFAYTAGFLAHYAVDSHTHPYIFSQTYDPPKPAIKEAGRHRHFETTVDVLMLKRLNGEAPNDYNLGQLLTPDKRQRSTAAAGTAAAIRRIYDRDINPRDVDRAMGQMASNTNKLQSKTGRRKRWLGNVENLILRAKVLSALTHMQEVTEDRDFLNLEKTEWSPPWAQDKIRNDSFVELFDRAVGAAVQMIKALFDYTHDNLPKEAFAACLQNRSLITGQNP